MSIGRAACRRVAVVCGAAALWVSPARADTTYLVQDLGARVADEWVDYFQAPFNVSMGGVAYFYRSDGLHGRELWRSDGTAVGTYMVRDVCPGLCGIEAFSEADTLAVVDSLVYFSGNDGVHGAELWATDGTAGGTRMVADLRPGPQSSAPVDFASAAGLLYFTADDGVRGWELARSDGTTAGTYLIDVEPGPSGSSILLIAPGGGQLFLLRGGAQTGLWRSDGTAAGTEPLLLGISAPIIGWHKGHPFRALPNGVLVFQGCSAQSYGDCELWRSDGTAAGTFRLADLVPGVESSFPSGFAPMGGEFWFSAGPGPGGMEFRKLYRTDGTVAGTSALPQPVDLYAFPSNEVHAGSLFFVGEDSTHGAELWVTDGVTTQLVTDLRPGSDGALLTIPGQMPYLASVGGDLLFLADDGSGLGLWKSDGSAAGTTLLTDFGAPSEGSFHFDYLQNYVTAIRGGIRLVLPVWVENVGLEIWASDGTAAGTSAVRTIASQRNAFFETVRWTYNIVPARCATPLRHGLVVAAADEISVDTGSFYFLDGVPDGATLLGPAFDPLSPFVAECAGNGNEALALGGFTDASGLLRTHGVVGDATLLLPVADNGAPGSQPFFERLQDQLAFSLDDLLYLAPEGAEPPDFTTWPTEGVGGRLRAGPSLLYFGGSFSGLSVTDGASYTTLVPPPVPPAPDVELDDLITSGDRAYFSLRTDANGAELWTSDGTVAGTWRTRDIRPGPASPFPRRELWEFWNRPREPRIAGLGDGRAVFAADDGVHGNELWLSDGTEAGTVLLADVVPGPDGSWPRHLTGFGGAAFFTAEDPKRGLELWRTDGTPAGTALVRDLVVGPESSIPEELSVQDGLLYFSAWTPSHGREAWRSDGTATGTFRITDIVPGSRSSNPNRFVRSGELLFFVANDEIHGREVWAIAPDGFFPLFLDGFESADTARWSAAQP